MVSGRSRFAVVDPYGSDGWGTAVATSKRPTHDGVMTHTRRRVNAHYSGGRSRPSAVAFCWAAGPNPDNVLEGREVNRTTSSYKKQLGTEMLDRR